jgi:hypothetical protein
LGWLARGGLSDDDARALALTRRSDRAGARAGAALASLVAGAADLDGLADLPAILGPSYMKVIQVAWTAWGGGSEESAIVAIAAGLGQGLRFVKALVDAVPLSSDASARSSIVFIATSLGAFSEPGADMFAVRRAENLSADQRAIATSLCRFGGADVGRGVPRSMYTRRRWLGIAPPGALEKSIDVDGKPTPLWAAWKDARRRDPKDEWPKVVLDSLDPDELVEAYGEVLTMAYDIEANRPPLSPQPVLDAIPRIGPRAVAWARRYTEELTQAYAAGDWPECGGIQAIPGAAAVYLMLSARGEPIPESMHAHFPAHLPVVASAVLERLSDDVIDQAIWAWLHVPFRASQHVLKLRFLVPHIERIRAPRIREHLVGCLSEANSASPGSPEIEKARDSLRGAGVAV